MKTETLIKISGKLESMLNNYAPKHSVFSYSSDGLGWISLGYHYNKDQKMGWRGPFQYITGYPVPRGKACFDLSERLKVTCSNIRLRGEVKALIRALRLVRSTVDIQTIDRRDGLTCSQLAEQRRTNK